MNAVSRWVEQVGRLRAHLFAGARCSCDTVAGVCDERALSPGFLTPADAPSQQGGPPCSWNPRAKRRTRAPRGATRRASSSAATARSSTAAPRKPASPRRTRPLLPSTFTVEPELAWKELTTCVVYLETRVSASLPSSFSLSITLLFGSVCPPEQGRSSLQGRNNHQKTSLRPHAERLVRGRGPGVLSCPITSVPFILQGTGGEEEPGSDGGRMERRETGGVGGSGGCFYCQICFISHSGCSGQTYSWFIIVSRLHY